MDLTINPFPSNIILINHWTIFSTIFSERFDWYTYNILKPQILYEWFPGRLYWGALGHRPPKFELIVKQCCIDIQSDIWLVAMVQWGLNKGPLGIKQSHYAYITKLVKICDQLLGHLGCSNCPALVGLCNLVPCLVTVYGKFMLRNIYITYQCNIDITG